MILTNLIDDIENRAARLHSYIEAILEYKEEKNIDDFEDITEQLNASIIEKVKMEFKLKHYFPEETFSNPDGFFEEEPEEE